MLRAQLLPDIHTALSTDIDALYTLECAPLNLADTVYALFKYTQPTSFLTNQDYPCKHAGKKSSKL
jgi:hypothetical protein